MDWKSVWNDWKLIMLACVVNLGAFLLNMRAWHAGYNASALGLLGCHFLSFLLLLVSGGTVIAIFDAVARKAKPATRGVRVLDVAVLCLFFAGCCGLYFVWPVVLVLLASLLFTALIFSSTNAGSHEDRPTRSVIACAGTCLLLSTLTWYYCASNTRQGLRGLGARIQAKGGADKLKVWATEVLAAHKQHEQNLPLVCAMGVGLTASPLGQGPLLAASAFAAGKVGETESVIAREDLPVWIDDLLGPFEGVRSVGVNTRNDSCVFLYTGGSAYHFQIRVCPSHDSGGQPPWWLGEVAGLEWRPGIHLSTQGK